MPADLATQRYASALAARVHLAARVKFLSRRELQVYALTANGLRVPTIARELKLSQTTIRNQLKGVFGKIGVESQIELTELIWQARGRPLTAPVFSARDLPPLEREFGVRTLRRG